MEKTTDIKRQIDDFQVQRNIVALYKSFLILIEDLEQEHLANFEKLKSAIPPEFHPSIDQADWLDGEKMSYLRKKILDAGNNCIRNLF